MKYGEIKSTELLNDRIVCTGIQFIDDEDVINNIKKFLNKHSIEYIHLDNHFIIKMGNDTEELSLGEWIILHESGKYFIGDDQTWGSLFNKKCGVSIYTARIIVNNLMEGKPMLEGIRY